MYQCSGCKKDFLSQFLLILHMDSCKQKDSIVAIPPPVSTQDLVSKGKVGHKKIINFLLQNQGTIYDVLLNELNKCNKLKYNIQLFVTLTAKGQKEILRSKYIALDRFSAISDTINVLIELFIQSTDGYKGLKLDVNEMVVNVSHNHPRTEHHHHYYDETKNPSESASHFENFKILKWGVLEVKAVVHGNASDGYSFKWAMLAAMDCIMEKKPYLIDYIDNDQISYRGVDFDFTGLEFPFKMAQCGLFEQKNPGISINVFGAATTRGGMNKLIGPIYRTQCEQDIHINLLCYTTKCSEDYQYACIAKFSTCGYKNTYLCNTCLRCFWYKSCLISHKSDKESCISRIVLKINEKEEEPEVGFE